MSYNFNEIFKREGTGSVKWDKPRNEKNPFYTKAENMIPMWIADMDFATPECVIEAITNRCKHPLFGYFSPEQNYYDAIKHWQTSSFDVTYQLDQSTIMYQNSVLGAVSTFVSCYTLPNDNVLLNSPTYNMFMNIIKSLGRNVCPSALVLDDNDIYRLDFEDIEAKIVENNISTYIFCSPHNPTGRVWEKWELEKVIEICDKHNVKILSDEVWSDLVFSGKHTTILSVNEVAQKISTAVYSTSKTFNLAGISSAYSITLNQDMKEKLFAFSKSTFYNSPNILSCYALIGAYEGGADWVDELKKYIRINQEYVVNYINDNFKDVHAYLPEGTYLVWVDFTKCNKDFDEIYSNLKELGVLPNNGKDYLMDKFLRLNVGCPYSYCVESMERFSKVLG